MLSNARPSALHRLRTRGLTRAQLGYVLVTPALLMVLGVIVAPLVQTVALALQTVRLNRPDLPQGFNNFQNFQFLVQDPNYWSAVRVSALFVVANVTFCLLLGTGIGLILNQAFFARGVVRASVLIPWAMPGVVIAILWKFMFNDQYGVVNDILLRLGVIPSYQNVLGGPWAVPSAMFVMIWRATPFTSFLVLAGLQMIPGELYEAARIDGAGAVKRFFYITLPLVKPSLLIALIFRTLDAFREFDILYVFTAGGPGVSTTNLSLYTYKTYFTFMNFGYGATVAFSMTLLSAVIVVFYIRLVGLQLASRSEH